MEPYLEMILQPLLLQSYLFLFLISFIICSVVIFSSVYGFNSRAALDQDAIQSAHTGFAPRVGGLAVYLSIVALVPILNFGFIPISFFFELNVGFTSLLILSGSFIFVVGTAEDLGYLMSPLRRIFTSVISSLFTIVVFRAWISQLGIPPLDFLLSFSPIGIIFTIFATVGIINAFNLIDGLNGLSSYISISTALSLSYISFAVDNNQISIFLLLMSASVAGFMVLNFPFGKIFLGDGGAYVLGHLLVWCAILLINIDQSISPFAILLIFFWPVADTGLAIWRRLKHGNRTDRPDKLHFHQIAMRFLEIRFLGRNRRHISNPVATIILIPFISMPQIFGVLFWNSPITSMWCSAAMTILFISSYIYGINLAKRGRLKN